MLFIYHLFFSGYVLICIFQTIFAFSEDFPNENLYNKNVIKENIEVFNEYINEKAAEFSQRYDNVNVFVYNVNEELNIWKMKMNHHIDHYIWVDDHFSK
ncbi:hypothetical protein H8356DRAFT_1431952 [Neocallimastix lanati (nom. inval.)]|nr:hypothetical protein H8356DRAFT_1431952 [Neocallimastix sp. JGI-2020a]